MKDLTKLSPIEVAAILARREYDKAYRKKNPEKIKMYQKKYWCKKAVEMGYNIPQETSEK